MTQTLNTEKQNTPPPKIYLKDYTPPLFEVEYLHLFFDLNEEESFVTSEMKITGHQNDLFLNGEEVELVDLWIDENKIDSNLYQINKDGLSLKLPKKNETISSTQQKKMSWNLRIKTRLFPQNNTSLEGLYKSNGIFCTQCEAQGFRKITYFFDRPDVMTQYKVKIQADQKKYPVLLSNGNRLSQKILENGKHEVVWEDPHKKPCYLFALVAGDLGVIKDLFTTRSGKKVDLEIYSAHGTQNRCSFAMESLKKSMKWDEERFDREYDLNTYMILAVDDFNAGAMENKGLNIFNSRLIFANPETATDDDYFAIESVVAHEYFHNWTGNRVTLRDWFHLSLKEGLTVFRDQEFSMDQSSRGVIRIESVQTLRERQFSEDSGPNAHPIRPSDCYAVDNFFTATIYEKGSEIIRMMQTMVGRPGFKKGMDLYFQRHDGQAVIIEDFAKAISDANNQQWDQFKLWYSQAGTPHVIVKESFDTGTGTYCLDFEQSCALTSREKNDPEFLKIGKHPFHIPMVFALLDSSGKEISIDNQIKNNNLLSVNSEGETLFHLRTQTARISFTGFEKKPTLSLNRNFSAPIHLDIKTQNESDLLFLMKHDQDPFNRWEASQRLYLQTLNQQLLADQKKQNFEISPGLVEGIQSILSDSQLDTGMKAELILLPRLDYWVQMEKNIDGRQLQKSRDQVSFQIAKACEKQFLAAYEKFHGKNTTVISNEEFSNRKFKNRCLSFLSMLPQYSSLIIEQFKSANSMTDYQASFSLISKMNIPEREQVIESFYLKWKNESLVLNKWFAIQAISTHPDTFDRVKKLMTHPEFNIKNPNRVYSLLRTFGANLSEFHQETQNTYDFYADQIFHIDQLNPQVAARLAGNFGIWTDLKPNLKEKARKALTELLNKGLSKNTHEIIQNCVDADKNASMTI